MHAASRPCLALLFCIALFTAPTHGAPVAQYADVLQLALAPSDDALDEEDLLIEEGEEPPAKPAAPAPAAPAPARAPDTAASAVPSKSAPVQPAAGPSVRDEEDVLVPDTTAPAATAKQAAPAPIVRAADVKVEEERSVNFAEGLKGYRSPKLAMLMSLIIPGTGQIYAQRAYKAGIYLAIEAAVIGTSVGFLRKGNRHGVAARRHADTTYSYDKFRVYYDTLWQGLKERDGTERAAEIADSIFKTDLFGLYDTAFDTASFRTRYYQKQNDEYYRLIEDKIFVQGWKDAKPLPIPDMVRRTDSVLAYSSGDTAIYTRASASGLYYKFDMYRRGYNAQTGDSTLTLVKDQSDVYGVSRYYDIYRNLLSEQNKYHRIAGNVLYVVLVNHIVSAIDAGITAKMHNDRLLGRKTSLISRLRIDQEWVNTGSETVPSVALTLRF